MSGKVTKEVTVDRISNGGNPIASDTHDGKAVHVPGRRPGDRLLVRLTDMGGHYRATVVDRYETAQVPRTTGPKGPSSDTGATPSLIQLGEELCGDEPLTIEQRHSQSTLAPAEYPGKDHRKTIATRHD